LLSALAVQPPRARPRGAAHEAFLQLFARPFDGGAVARFRAEADVDVALASAPGDRAASAVGGRPRWLPFTLVAAGAAAALTGAGLGVSGHLLAREARAGDGQDVARLAPRIEARNRAAVVTGTAGVVAAGVGLAWAWWSRP
jgi:hypothetical protein